MAAESVEATIKKVYESPDGYGSINDTYKKHTNLTPGLRCPM